MEEELVLRIINEKLEYEHIALSGFVMEYVQGRNMMDTAPGKGI